MSTSNLEILRALMDKVMIPSDIQDDLLGVFAELPTEDFEQLLIMLSGDQSLLVKLADNLEAKRIALETKDTSLWNKIVEEEVKLLQSIKE